MSVKREAPEAGSYRFVLRRYDVTPDVEEYVQGYERGYRTRSIEIDGVRARTLFISEKPFRDRLMTGRFGPWKDETAKWFARLEGRSETRDPGAPNTPTADELHALFRELGAEELLRRIEDGKIVAPREARDSLAEIVEDLRASRERGEKLRAEAEAEARAHAEAEEKAKAEALAKEQAEARERAEEAAAEAARTRAKADMNLPPTSAASRPSNPGAGTGKGGGDVGTGKAKGVEVG